MSNTHTATTHPSQKRFGGWGRTNATYCYSISPHCIDDATASMIGRSTIARGMGRSYGDAAQNSGALVLQTDLMNKIRPIDSNTGLVTVDAGVTFDQLLRRCVRAGWFVPVSPGTRQVTIGGAIASDIHGKNHHHDGSFGSHVTSLKIRTGRGLETLSPTDTPAEFWATAGGMGLTGVITEATIRLRPIETAFMATQTERFANLDSLMTGLAAADLKSDYSVAWLDTLSQGTKLGRGVVLAGHHATQDEITATKYHADPLAFAPHSMALPPVAVPLLTPSVGRGFNGVWYRLNRPGERIETIGSFFHPLDAIRNWNLLYGRRGFVQWQIVLPDSAAGFIHDALLKLTEIGAGSFLSVLKRFGAPNPGPLSFPTTGWTLAVDLPVGTPGLAKTLSDLDCEIARLGGRVYLAKDARLDPGIVEAMYPRLQEWQHIRAGMDPNNMFRSDLGQRLNLIPTYIASDCLASDHLENR